jgi:hypothetical protein
VLGPDSFCHRRIQQGTHLAQDQPVVKPETVGLSSERLERIGKTVQRDIGDKRIAGVVTLVIRHGQVAWFRAMIPSQTTFRNSRKV